MPTLTDSQRHALLEGVFRTMDDGVIVLDREFNIILANEWIERRYADKMPLAGQKCHSALFGSEDRCPACPFLRSIEIGTPQRQVVKVSTGRDSATWLELCTYPLRDPAGAAVGAIEHVKDITDVRQMEEQLRDEMARRQILVGESPDGYVVLGLDGKVCEANEQYARMLGYTSEEIRQLHIWDWDVESDKVRLLNTLERAEAARDHFETRYRRKDGTLIEVEVGTSGAVIGGKTLVFHFCRDITERKAMQKQIREIGVRDPLTDVYNARYIFERLAEISAEYSRGKGDFWVSILDIDDFKAVNEFHGQKAGDFALKEFAHTLDSVVRPYDLLGRYAGEKFILVSRNTTGPTTIAMMERIMGMVRAMVVALEGHQIRLTLSCGLAHSSEFAPDAFSIDVLVARAEQRLSAAKAAGRDRWVGPPSDDGPEQSVARQLGDI